MPTAKQTGHTFWLVEKANHNSLHGIFSYRESAERFLLHTVPDYVMHGYYSDKTLTASSFEIIPGKH